MKLFPARPAMLGFGHHSMYTYIYLSNFQPLLNLNLSWPWEIAKVIVLQCQVLSRALRIHSGAFGKQKCLHKSFMMFSFLHVLSKLIIRVQVALGYMFYVNMLWLDERCPDILNTSGDWWLFHPALLIKSFMFFPCRLITTFLPTSCCFAVSPFGDLPKKIMHSILFQWRMVEMKDDSSWTRSTGSVCLYSLPEALVPQWVDILINSDDPGTLENTNPKTNIVHHST